MHNLDMITVDRAAMAYKGTTPWHDLGQRLSSGRDVDQWRVEAGLDWTINKSPVFYATVDSDTQDIFKGKKVLVRSDTQAALSIVSDRYKVVQPYQVLEFFRDLVSDGNMELETAGALDGGKKIWALATTQKAYGLGTRLETADIIKPYVMLVTSCDGTSSTHAYFTTVRVVCQNTLAMSVKDRASGVTVRHSAVFSDYEVKKSLGLIDDVAETFMDDADTLASKAINDSKAVNYFAELYIKKDKAGETQNEKQLERVVNEIMGLYKNGPGAQLPTARGTAWGALNAVTRYVDHHARSHSTNNRFRDAQFGKGADTKKQALVAALEI